MSHLKFTKKLYSKVAVYLGSSWVLIEAASFFIEKLGYPDYYWQILLMLLFFGLISFIYQELLVNADDEQGAPFIKPIYFHAAILTLSFFSAYLYFDYANTRQLQFSKSLAADVSIAVLPFDNMGPNTDDNWMGDMISDEIIDRLNTIESIDVKSRSASFYFRDKDYNPVQIANLLNVNTLLEGSYALIDTLLQVSVKLMNPHTGSLLWNYTYNQPMSSILDMRSDIALTVAEKINAAYTEKEKQEISYEPSQNKEALKAYLQGKYHYNQITMNGNYLAHNLFKKAIALDPDFAEAYVYLGFTYNMFGGMWLGMMPDEAYKKVKELAEKALLLKPNLPIADFLKANYTYFYQRDFKKGLAQASAAFEKSNQKEDMIRLYPLMLSLNKLPQESCTILTAYIEKNPTSALAYQSLCHALVIMEGREIGNSIDSLLATCNKAMELDPTAIQAKYYMAELFYWRKEYEVSSKHFKELTQLVPGAPHFVEGLFRTTYLSGDTVAAMQYYEQLMLVAKQFGIPYIQGRIYATLDQMDSVTKYLNLAYEMHDIEMVALWNEPAYDPVRKYPEFQEILARLEYAGDFENK